MSTTGDRHRSRAPRRVRAVIERVIAKGTLVARSDGSLHELFPVAASAAEGRALREWIVRERATRTIEIGLGYGISVLHVCEGLLANATPTVHHAVIEPYRATSFSDCGLQLLEEACISGLVEHHAQESQLTLPRLRGERRVFDLACIDGNHRFDGIFGDLLYLGRLVRPGVSFSSMTTSCRPSRGQCRSS